LPYLPSLLVYPMLIKLKWMQLENKHMMLSRNSFLVLEFGFSRRTSYDHWGEHCAIVPLWSFRIKRLLNHFCQVNVM
jgi:hypothetical protein